MGFKHLRYFITVAEHLNFTVAAKHLYIAQPALSNSIANLEMKLGVKLFERNKHSVQLTKAGALFLKEAIKIIAIFDEAIIEMRQLDSGFTGSLKIGFLTAQVKRLLPQWVNEFRSQYPNIELNLRQLTMAPLHEALEQGNVDIGFTRSFDLINTKTIYWKKLFDDKISLVMRSDNPLLNRKPLTYSALAREPLIVLSRQEAPPFFDLVIKICKNRGFTPNIVCTPDLMETIFILTDAGIGLTFLPTSSKNDNYPNLQYIDIEGEDTKIDIVIAWKKATSNPVVPLFIDFIESVYKT